MPPTLTTPDPLTAAQIKRIYGLGFAAGLKSFFPSEGPVDSCIDEIRRLKEKQNEHIKLVGTQSQLITDLRNQLAMTRAVALMLVGVIFLLLVALIVLEKKRSGEVIVTPAAEGSGRA